MENILVKTASFALHILKEYIRSGDCVIDATAGNGNDTLKLCELVGEQGKVYAFDIQQAALDNTAALLKANLKSNATLFLASHARIGELIHEPIQAAIFNLGYLPGGDHTVTTCIEDTKTAITACLNLLKKDGMIAVVFYPGHPAGAEEKQKILPWLSGLNSGMFHCAHIEMINQSKSAPSVLFITRKKEDACHEA